MVYHSIKPIHKFNGSQKQALHISVRSSIYKYTETVVQWEPRDLSRVRVDPIGNQALPQQRNRALSFLLLGILIPSAFMTNFYLHTGALFLLVAFCRIVKLIPGGSLHEPLVATISQISAGKGV